MTGFEPRTSGIKSNRSTNWATTTAHEQTLLCVCEQSILYFYFSKCHSQKYFFILMHSQSNKNGSWGGLPYTYITSHLKSLLRHLWQKLFNVNHHFFKFTFVIFYHWSKTTNSESFTKVKIPHWPDKVMRWSKNSFTLDREHWLMWKYHCSYTWPPVYFVWIVLLWLCWITNSFTCLVES